MTRRYRDGVRFSPAGMLAGDRLGLIVLGLCWAFRACVRGGLRVADGFGQHLAQFRLRLRWLPRDRSPPLSHDPYMGMREWELNPWNHTIWLRSGR